LARTYLSTVAALGLGRVEEAHAYLAVVMPVAFLSLFLPVCLESSLAGHLEFALVAADNLSHVVCRVR
jgi:hypothetical protein